MPNRVSNDLCYAGWSCHHQEIEVIELITIELISRSTRTTWSSRQRAATAWVCADMAATQQLPEALRVVDDIGVAHAEPDSYDRATGTLSHQELEGFPGERDGVAENGPSARCLDHHWHHFFQSCRGS